MYKCEIFPVRQETDMKKTNLIMQLYKSGVVAVIRGATAEQAEKSADACIAGGIKFIEVTFTAPDADKVISRLSKKYPDAYIGAGTVLDSQTARIAMLAGAKYIVSPALDVDTVKICNKYRVPCMTGVMTPTEAVAALEYGVDVIKLFPGDVLKPAGLKGFKGPLPQANIMPTGGVSMQNVGEWFKAGAFAVGAGSFLTEGAKSGDYGKVEETARELVAEAAKYIQGR